MFPSSPLVMVPMHCDQRSKARETDSQVHPIRRPFMNHSLLCLFASLALTGTAMAQGVAAPGTGTHVDSTVRGDARSDSAADPGNAQGLDNDHHFEAGAPHLTEMAASLDLSAHQKTQLNDIIERGDAGAAVLIKREHDVKEMLEKTPAQDPRYAELRAEQSNAPARWLAARNTVHQEIRDILTPAQQAKFEQLRAERQTAPQ
jgi:Spy/CpxP family protein refolding chaperone